MLERYPGKLAEFYGRKEEGTDVEILEGIGEIRKCLKKGEEVDLEKTAALLLDDFRNARLGRISLEFPEKEG